MAYSGKVILVGDPNVGKTSLLARYIDGQFREEYVQTVGANFLIKEIELKGLLDKVELNDELKQDIGKKGFKLYFWDICGQQDKLIVTEYYFHQAVGAMVVFNIVNQKSLENLDFWMSKLKELSGEIPFVIVGNKTDLTEEEKPIDKKIVSNKLKQFGVECIETSAKLNDNVDAAFERLCIQILNNLK